MKNNFKTLLAICVVVTSFTFISCDKEEDNIDATQKSETQVLPDKQVLPYIEDLLGDDLYSVPGEDEELILVEGTFEEGMNYINGYNIAIYPDLFSPEPIECEIFLGKKVRKSGSVTLPNGVVMTNCPSKGDACGTVHWRGDEIGDDPKWRFIGYYD